MPPKKSLRPTAVEDDPVIEVNKTMAAAVLKAALGHPTAKLWAEANHVDNFTLAISRSIDGAIVDVVIAATDNEAYITWFEKYLHDDPKHRPSYRGDTRSPCHSPFVRKIAAEAYAKLREGMPPWRPHSD